MSHGKNSDVQNNQEQSKEQAKESICNQVKSETARSTATFCTKAETGFLEKQAESNESIKEAKKVIKAWKKEFDQYVDTSEATKNQLRGYKLGPNEFVWNHYKTADSVCQAPIMKVNNGLVYFRNGNWEGRSVFTLEEFEGIMDQQMCCEKTCYEQETVECKEEKECKQEKPRFPECVPGVKKCEHIQNVINVHPTIIMVMPNQTKEQCCLTKCDKPNENVVQYCPEKECYDVKMHCEDKCIEGSFPDPDFHAFLNECGEQVCVDKLEKSEHCSVKPIPTKVERVCAELPQCVTNKPTCGLPLEHNQVAICNAYDFCDPDPVFNDYQTCAYDNVFPICQQNGENFEVIINGNKCEYDYDGFCAFVKEYHKDHCHEVEQHCGYDEAEKPQFEPCCVERGERYQKQYLKKHYRNRLNNLDHFYGSKIKREEIRINAKEDRLKSKAQRKLDDYYNLLEACKDPNSKKAQRKLKKAEKALAKYEKKYGKYAKRTTKLEEKYAKKTAKVTAKGQKNLEKRRGRDEDKFNRRRDRALKKAKRKFDRNND